jgi:hypothetical protein
VKKLVGFFRGCSTLFLTNINPGFSTGIRYTNIILESGL